jgi:hypothetical protein
MHALSFGAAGIPDVLDAAMRAKIYAELVLDEPLACMHVLVTGGTWHGLDLDDLSAQVGDLCTADVGSRAASAAAGRPIVVVSLGKDKEDKKKLSSVLAAQHELPKHVAVGTLTAQLAFVLTNFRLQGRTLPRLIISLNRHRPAWSPRLTLSWATCGCCTTTLTRSRSWQPCGTTSTTRHGTRGTGPTACGMERWRAQPLLPRALDFRLPEHARWRE